MLNPKGLEKCYFSPERSVTLKIRDMKYVHISSFAVLDVKFWMKEDDDQHTDHL